MKNSEKEILCQKKTYTMTDLLNLMAVLRSEEGCPWDRAQTHESIRRCLLEEAYETAEAIDLADLTALCEELGDLLFQIVFHTRIEEEAGHFTFEDVTSGICRKMIDRHPHVFAHPGGDVPDWNKIKSQQKGQTLLSQRLDAIPKPLPALMRAEKLVERLAQDGKQPKDFGIAQIDLPALNESGALNEEFDPVQADTGLHEAVGNRLLCFVTDCYRMGIDCEQALAEACDRVIQLEKMSEAGE